MALVPLLNFGRIVERGASEARVRSLMVAGQRSAMW